MRSEGIRKFQSADIRGRFRGTLAILPQVTSSYRKFSLSEPFAKLVCPRARQALGLGTGPRDMFSHVPGFLRAHIGTACFHHLIMKRIGLVRIDVLD